MTDGETLDVRSASSDSVWRIKRTGDHYYCTCPAWRNQDAPVVRAGFYLSKNHQNPLGNNLNSLHPWQDARTCKHLRAHLGDAHEDARCGTAVSRPRRSAANGGGPPGLPNSTQAQSMKQARAAAPGGSSKVWI
jgi:DNA ligase-1